MRLLYTHFCDISIIVLVIVCNPNELTCFGVTTHTHMHTYTHTHTHTYTHVRTLLCTHAFVRNAALVESDRISRGLVCYILPHIRTIRKHRRHIPSTRQTPYKTHSTSHHNASASHQCTHETQIRSEIDVHQISIVKLTDTYTYTQTHTYTMSNKVGTQCHTEEEDNITKQPTRKLSHVEMISLFWMAVSGVFVLLSYFFCQIFSFIFSIYSKSSVVITSTVTGLLSRRFVVVIGSRTYDCRESSLDTH